MGTNPTSCAANKYGLEPLKRLSLRKQGLHSGIQCSAILASASNELRYGRGSTSVALEFQNMMTEVDTAIRGGRLMEAAAMLQQLLRTSPNEPSARAKLEQVNRMMSDVETQRRRSESTKNVVGSSL